MDKKTGKAGTAAALRRAAAALNAAALALDTIGDFGGISDGAGRIDYADALKAAEAARGEMRAALLVLAAHNARVAEKRREKTVATLIRDQWKPKNWRKLDKLFQAQNAQPTLSGG